MNLLRSDILFGGCRSGGARSHLTVLGLRSSHLPVLKLRSFGSSHFGPSQVEDASHLTVLELRSSHLPVLKLRSSHLPVLKLRSFGPSHFGPSQLEDASHLTVLELRFFEPSHFAFSLAPALRPVARRKSKMLRT